MRHFRQFSNNVDNVAYRIQMCMKKNDFLFQVFSFLFNVVLVNCLVLVRKVNIWNAQSPQEQLCYFDSCLKLGLGQ